MTYRPPLKLQKLKPISKPIESPFYKIQEFFKTNHSAVIESAKREIKAVLLMAVEELWKKIKVFEQKAQQLDVAIEHALSVKNGEPGKDADEQKIIEQVLLRIPIPKDGKSVNQEDVVREILSKITIPIPKEVDIEEVIKKILTRIPKLQPKQVNEERIISRVLGKIKFPEQEVFTKQMFLEWISSLPDGTLEIKDIKNLEERLRNLASKIMLGGSIMKGGGDAVLSYDISSQLNGTLKTFTIPQNNRVLMVSSSSFPNTFRENVDYTYTATTITFTSEITASSTLATGQSIIILYTH